MARPLTSILLPGLFVHEMVTRRPKGDTQVTHGWGRMTENGMERGCERDSFGGWKRRVMRRALRICYVMQGCGKLVKPI